MVNLKDFKIQNFSLEFSEDVVLLLGVLVVLLILVWFFRRKGPDDKLDKENIKEILVKIHCFLCFCRTFGEIW